jgi:phenylacetate-CoA ligase
VDSCAAALATVQRGWETPFFQRHWRGAGLEPGAIRSLDDLIHLPPYGVVEIRESIERNPPLGDFMGISPADV